MPPASVLCSLMHSASHPRTAYQAVGGCIFVGFSNAVNETAPCFCPWLDALASPILLHQTDDNNARLITHDQTDIEACD